MPDRLSRVHQSASGRGDELEGDLDAPGVLRRGADALDHAGGEVGGGGGVEGEGMAAEVGVGPGEPGAVPGQARRSRAGGRRARSRPAGAATVSAATSIRTPHGTPPAAIAASRAAAFSSKLGREVGDHQHAIGLGDLAGHRVVLLERRVLVPQVLLRDLLHVGGEVGQPLLDLAGVGPDLAG